MDFSSTHLKPLLKFHLKEDLKKKKKKLFVGVATPLRFLNVFCNILKNYYHAAVVENSGHLVLSWWCWGKKYQKFNNESTNSYKGVYIKYVGVGGGGFYKFLKKYFVAQGTIELNIS